MRILSGQITDHLFTAFQMAALYKKSETFCLVLKCTVRCFTFYNSQLFYFSLFNFARLAITIRRISCVRGTSGSILVFTFFPSMIATTLMEYFFPQIQLDQILADPLLFDFHFHHRHILGQFDNVHETGA